MKYRDITFTVNLDEISVSDYEKIISLIKVKGTGDINTDTYKFNDAGCVVPMENKD